MDERREANNETVAVVIPHFQRHPGVLARTLAAMFQQTWGSPSHVVIVDDSSPAPARNELAALDDMHRSRIEIIHRPNGGPARARNTGLDAAAKTADFVALSDCDDIWSPWHLDDAMTAMRLGHDFFFGDHIRESDEASQFITYPIDTAEHRLLDAEHQLYAWTGNLFDAVLRYPLIGLSTVLFRTSTFGALRFRDSVGLADDMFYALDVACTPATAAFSRRLQAVYGRGDNISVVKDWRSNNGLFSIASLARYSAEVLSTARLDASQRRFMTARLKQERRDFATTLLAMLKAGTPVDANLVRGFLRDQPATLAYLPSVLLATLRQRLTRSSR